jgi:hypothetical protein
MPKYRRFFPHKERGDERRWKTGRRVGGRKKKKNNREKVENFLERERREMETRREGVKRTAKNASPTDDLTVVDVVVVTDSFIIR